MKRHKGVLYISALSQQVGFLNIIQTTSNLSRPEQPRLVDFWLGSRRSNTERKKSTLVEVTQFWLQEKTALPGFRTTTIFFSNHQRHFTPHSHSIRTCITEIDFFFFYKSRRFELDDFRTTDMASGTRLLLVIVQLQQFSILSRHTVRHPSPESEVLFSPTRRYTRPPLDTRKSQAKSILLLLLLLLLFLLLFLFLFLFLLLLLFLILCLSRVMA